MAKRAERKKKEKRKKSSFIKNIGIGKEKDYLIENLSMLIVSGIPLIDAFESIKNEMRTRRMRKAIQTMHDEVSSGSPLWRAIEATGLFSRNVVYVIRVGEEAGRLPQNLRIVADQQQKNRSFKSKLKAAMIYPVMVFFITITVGLGVGWFILPRLSKIFDQLKIDLPAVTKVMMKGGVILEKNGIVGLAVVIGALFLFFYVIFFAPRTRRIGQIILFHIPPIKKIIQEIEVSRFGYVVGTLLDAGLSVVSTLEFITDAASFKVYEKFYAHLKDSVTQGNSFQKSFDSFHRARRLIPTPVMQIIVAGEQSGHLPDSLVRVGQIYEEKVDNSTKNLPAILEPILLVIVWLGVVTVAIAIILPIYSLIGGLDKATGPKDPAPKSDSRASKSTKGTKTIKQIQANANVKKIDVFEKPSASSKVISSLEPKKAYNYQEKKDKWYRIAAPGGKNGWVLAKQVKMVGK